jgi:hypothetical protein
VPLLRWKSYAERRPQVLPWRLLGQAYGRQASSISTTSACSVYAIWWGASASSTAAEDAGVAFGAGDFRAFWLADVPALMVRVQARSAIGGPDEPLRCPRWASCGTG